MLILNPTNLEHSVMRCTVVWSIESHIYGNGTRIAIEIVLSVLHTVIKLQISSAREEYVSLPFLERD